MRTISVKNYDSVALRQKCLKDGRVSLYLDTYYKGVRKYEFLHLYLVPEVKRSDREQNRQTAQLAEAIRYRREVDMIGERNGIRTIAPSDVLFYPYFEEQVRRKKTDNTKQEYQAVMGLLKEYDGRENLTFASVTPTWVRGFRDWLASRPIQGRDRVLSESSCYIYFGIFKTVLHKAVKEEILDRSPAMNVDGFRLGESERMYLTVEELRQICNTPCKRQRDAEAFLFSCLTGLRYCDVTRLTWADVHGQGKYTRIIFQQKKTRKREYLDITKQAADLMGERGEPTERIFRITASTRTLNENITRWVHDAGIGKHITFHCARHTFATMMLSLGTDLYTVSKLLGHSNITTTQVYAKVLDRGKQAAMDAIPDILGA